MNQTTKNIVIGLGVAVFILLLFEAGARVSKTVRDDLNRLEDQDWVRYSAVLGWERRPNFKGIASKEYREFDAKGHVVRAGHSRAKGNLKIFLLGDSCTYGLGVDADSTFGAVLEEKMKGIQVVNLGVPGYSSFQGLQLLKKIIPQKPSLIIASFSFNDRRYVVHPKQKDSEPHFKFMSDWSWIIRPASFSYPLRALNHILADKIDLRTTQVRVSYQEYFSNLKEMAEIAQSHGIPLVFLLLADNPNFMDDIVRGLQRIDEGLPHKAIKAFKESMASHPFATALPKFYLAKTYEALGDQDLASQMAMIIPVISYDGGNPLRTDMEYARAMVEVSRQTGVYVYDARPVLREDPSVFIDSVHFDEMGHSRIGEGLYDFIVARDLVKFRSQDFAGSRMAGG